MVTKKKSSKTKKPTKSDLIADLKHFKDQVYKLTNQRDTAYKDIEKRGYEKREAIEDKNNAVKAMEVWKSAYYEAQVRIAQVEERLNALRDLISNALADKKFDKIDDPKMQKKWVNQIISKAAEALIKLEGYIKPFFHDYLPMPRLMKMFEEAAKKNKIEPQVPHGPRSTDELMKYVNASSEVHN
jgi:chromosome segregation ATPase